MHFAHSNWIGSKANLGPGQEGLTDVEWHGHSDD